MQGFKLGLFVNAIVPAVILVVGLATVSSAAEQGSEIVTADGITLRQVFSSGATVASTSTVRLAGTLGQPVIGTQANGGTVLFEGFWFGGRLGCCDGRVGDANGDGLDEPNISDISAIVDHLFISQRPLVCYAEADANQTGGRYAGENDISVGDISALVDYLFVTGPSRGLPACR